MNLLGDTVTDLMQSIGAKKNETIKDAIRETDWEETAVLDIVFASKLSTLPLDEESFAFKYRVERYSQRAPPQSVYYDSEHRFDVYRLTKPLLDKLAEEHDVVGDIL